MHACRSIASLLRSGGVVVASAALVVALGVLCVPAVGPLAHPRTAPRFDEVLVAGCAIAALLGAIALLAAAVGVLHDLLRGRVPAAGGPLRRLLLAACGVAVVAATTTGTARADSPSLDGLPVPDRATAAAVAHHRSVHVRPGDSLWVIAERQLGPDAPDADLSAYCLRLHRHNLAVIGPDPDLLLPGQVLQLPPSHPRPSPH